LNTYSYLQSAITSISSAASLLIDRRRGTGKMVIHRELRRDRERASHWINAIPKRSGRGKGKKNRTKNIRKLKIKDVDYDMTDVSKVC